MARSHMNSNIIEVKNKKNTPVFLSGRQSAKGVLAVLSFFSTDKPDNVSLNISTTKVCAGTAVTFTCSAGAANPAVQNYALYNFVGGLTHVSRNQTGVFKQRVYTKGQHNYRCEGSNSLASTSSSNKSLDVHGECLQP